MLFTEFQLGDCMEHVTLVTNDDNENGRINWKSEQVPRSTTMLKTLRISKRMLAD